MQGSLGIGLTLVAGPALISIDSGFAPGPLLLVGQVISCRHVLAERHHVDVGTFRRCLIGLPIGLVAGLTVLELVSEQTLAIVIGLLTASAAVGLLAGMRVRRSSPVDVATGAATSFGSVTAGLPGPPIAIGFSEMSPREMRGTASAFILTQAIIGWLGLVVTGNFAGREVELSAWLLPGVVLGMVLARFLRPLVDRNWFRPAILVIALAGGVALVIKQLV